MSSPTTPPVWNVRMVSCVPGSPIDWAAMTPTASPSSILLPVRERLAVAQGADALGRASQVSTERTRTRSMPRVGRQLGELEVTQSVVPTSITFAHQPASRARRGRGRRATSRGSCACRPGPGRDVLDPDATDAAAVPARSGRSAPGRRRRDVAREVAGVGRAKRRVRQSLAGAVGRDEVLEHGQALRGTTT